ncbi:MAG: efflux RND transporter periplasmic adaptor subunit [Limisphaerales bacterium]
MKSKSIIIGGAIVVCLALGIFAFIKFRGGAAPASDGESADGDVQTVVAVQVGALQRMTLHRYVTGYGTVEAAPAMENQPAAGGTLAAPTAGVVAKVNVIAGQSVKEGDVLVELNSATATFDYAKAEIERQKKLFEQQNTSRKNLEDAQAQLTSLEIVAPVSGTVTSISVKSGQAVDVNAPVAEVIDLNRLAVIMKIPAAQAGELKAGEEVQISGTGVSPVTNGQDARSTTAMLSFVSPAVDVNDGTISAWAALPANSGLRPGEFVDLKIVTTVHTNCLAAPSEGVVTDESGSNVVALVHGNEAVQTPVQTGFRENGWVEVHGAGLKDGDTVVTVGAYGLPDKTQIQVVNASENGTSATNSYSSQAQ